MILDSFSASQVLTPFETTVYIPVNCCTPVNCSALFLVPAVAMRHSTDVKYQSEGARAAYVVRARVGRGRAQKNLDGRRQTTTDVAPVMSLR